MKTAVYGRIVFGVAAILFGVIALMWHDADTWQNLIRILSLPLGVLIGTCLMVAQIVGGIGLPFARTERWASITLSLVYLLSSLVCLSGIVGAPRTFGQYDSFFEQFSLLCGALAVYAATSRSAARSNALGNFARVGIGLCAICFMLAQIMYLHFTASLVPAWIPPNQMFWAVLTTIAFGLAAIATLINVRTRLALSLMTLMLALFGLLVWVPTLSMHPQAHGNWSEFALNFQITGAAWMVASMGTLR